ncbi:MAG: SDR family oxidoreductase, partial [Gemmatimonadetes bacterium]|nr:SDR family oxidoreductase [Gemmatimonadota bacterium]
LGGIALEVAEELARTARARLVLVGRTPLPPRAEWGRADDRCIRRVQRLEELGAEVMVAGADVTDAAAMRAVVAEARARFGALHGVIHAAGVLEDGLIQGKTPETAARVLAPKVAGTMALDAALEGIDLDFFIAFSSRGSITGVAGQVDYAAANAFLDAFAQRKAAHDGIPAVSINWSAWQEVGMTARATGTTEAPLSHPVFTERYRGAGGEEVFSARMSAGGHWLLGEHRMSTGEALIPGTGYLELARAAWREHPGAGDVELRDVLFLSPFMVHGDEEKELRLVLRRDTGQFTIAGPVATEDGEVWQEHVRGTLASRPAAPLAPASLAELIGRCSTRRQEFSGQEQRRKQLILGPRWANLKRVDFGAGEAVARLELPAAFADDVGRFGLHPALLDVATACAQSLIPQQEVRDDFYVPASYGSVRVRGDLPRTLYSHIRLQPGDEGGDLAVFDVTLLDDRGAELVSISEFTMMRVAQAGITEGGERRRTVEMPARAAAKTPAGAEEGILPAEGIEAFRRIVRGDAPPQVIVSPQDLIRWMEHLRAPEPAPEAQAAPAGVDVTETEALLNAHDDISQAVVIARRDSRQGSTRITAYLVYEPGESLTASELRRHLRGRVDEDAVPQHFVELDELPTRPTGEIDRAALPDPFGEADDHVAPRTP